MTPDILTNDTIAGLGQKVQAFTDKLSPVEQAYMQEILTRAGAMKPGQPGYRWNPDPVLALRVSLRS